MMKKKSKISKLSIVVLYITIILIGLELGLRLLGYGPYDRPAPDRVKFLEADQKKGWVHIPGTYQYPVNTWGDTMNLVINEQRERITKTEPAREGLKKILLLGGSFTQGMGLDDEQTFAWKLQENFPSVDFRNLGVGAYGTYQSLLVLEEQLKNVEKPLAVIYGFIDNHKMRNVSESDWLISLSINAKYSNIELVLPYVSLRENGTLYYGKTPEIIEVPMADRLVISFMVQRIINKFLGRKRIRDADRVLEILLLKMQQLCKEKDVPFYVSIMASEKYSMSNITHFFSKNDLTYIDCNIPLNEQNTFRDDRHPKEEVNTEWAKRISSRLIQDGIVNPHADSLK